MILRVISVTLPLFEKQKTNRLWQRNQASTKLDWMQIKQQI